MQGRALAAQRSCCVAIVMPLVSGSAAPSEPPAYPEPTSNSHDAWKLETCEIETVPATVDGFGVLTSSAVGTWGSSTQVFDAGSYTKSVQPGCSPHLLQQCFCVSAVVSTDAPAVVPGATEKSMPSRKVHSMCVSVCAMPSVAGSGGGGLPGGFGGGFGGGGGDGSSMIEKCLGPLEPPPGSAGGATSTWLTAYTRVLASPVGSKWRRLRQRTHEPARASVKKETISQCSVRRHAAWHAASDPARLHMPVSRSSSQPTPTRDSPTHTLLASRRAGGGSQ